LLLGFLLNIVKISASKTGLMVNYYGAAYGGASYTHRQEPSRKKHQTDISKCLSPTQTCDAICNHNEKRHTIIKL